MCITEVIYFFSDDTALYLAYETPAQKLFSKLHKYYIQSTMQTFILESWQQGTNF